jgi:hypothetical protein
MSRPPRSGAKTIQDTNEAEPGVFSSRSQAKLRWWTVSRERGLPQQTDGAAFARSRIRGENVASARRKNHAAAMAVAREHDG